MANIDRPNGFKPVRYMNGAPYNGAHNEYLKVVGLNEAMFIGDIVTLAGSAGTAALEVRGVSVEGMPTIQLGAVSTDVLGVIVGFKPNADALSTNHSPALTAAIVMVADDPDLVFEIQEDSDSVSFGAVDVGRNVDSIAYAAGNTTTGQSILELDSSVTSVTTTAMCQLLRLVPRPGNNIGTNARWEVRFVEHVYRANDPSVGV